MENKEHFHYSTDMANLIERLHEYESIGLSPAYIRELKRRDTPAKIREIHVDEYYCPGCGSENCCEQGEVEHKFCPCCGQRLEIGNEYRFVDVKPILHDE